MGTTQTKLEDSKVSRREKKYWWKRGKTYITKKKKFEIHDGIPQEYEEIIEETKCEDYTKFKRTEIKTVHNRSGEPIQERDLKSSLMIASAKAGIKPDTFQTETIKKQPNMCMYKGRKDCRNLKGKSVYSSSSLDSGFKSSCKEKMFQPESRDNFATASVFDQYDIEQKFEKESNDETNEKILGPSRGTCEFHSIRDVKRKETIDSSSKLMLSMNGTDSMKNIPNHKNNKRKVSLNSLLDERKSSISSVSSHTEMKTRVTDMMPNLGMTHELQSMEQLKPNTYYNETNGESVEELKTFKETDDTDEEEADSNITDVKELSSSYPDSDLCSENSKIFTHSSEESFSLSSCRSQSSKADSTTMAKEVERYNNLSKTSTIKLGCDHNVINTLNISATDDKKSSTVTTNLKSTESSYCSTGPVMNSINGKMDSCEANQSEVRIGKDTVIIGMPTQSDIPDKASKGGNEIDDLTAFCIYMLKNKDRKCGQEETQKKEKIIIDFEVDYNNKNMPSVNKGLTARGQTRTSDEFLLNLEHSDIIHGIHGHENDFAEANVEVKVFLHVIFCLFLMILLYGKRKEEVKHEIESSLDDSMMHKTEMTVDKTVSNEQVISLDRADASAIHPGVNSPDNDSIISEIKSEISDTSDRCMIESEVNVNGEDRENVTIKLLLSDRVDDPVFQLKETSTEIDYNESVITVAENIEPVQNSFNQNENQLDCFDDTQVEQDNGDSIIANDYETDHKGYKMRPKESNCDVKLRIKIDILCTEKNCKVECQCDNILKLCEQEHHNYESKRVDNCAVGNYESKFKLSGSVERENGANHMPMDSSFNKKIECFLPSVDTKNSSLACKDENSIDKCCDRTFESLNKCQDRYESKVDLNGNLKNENHKKTDEGICTAHIDTYIKARKENGLIQKDTGTTDLVRPNRTDDKFSDNTAENISVGPFWNQKKCSPYMKNIANANIKIGATKRALKVKHDKLGTSQITDQQSLSSEDSIYYSHHSSGNSKIWQRNNKHRFRKNKKVSKKRGSLKESNICTTPVERDCESNTLQRKSFKAENFCHKCHHSKNSQNKNCSECRILDGELGSGKFQCQVRSKDDSGISSLLSSLRSSILSEMEHIQSFETTKLPGLKNRGKLIEKYYKLGTLNKELRNISKRFNDGVLLNTDHDIVVLPGLQSYFDSLRNGGTPSFQERMRYEWLRLMSFSNYTGGGSSVHLARNGFYHSQNNGTHCFCCNASYSDWTYSDNVQEVHRRISPNCPLVQGGIESDENISIESGTRDNQPHQAPTNLGSSSGTGVGQGTSHSGYHAERPAVPTNHGGFAGIAAQSPSFGFPSTTASGTSAPTFSFNPTVPRPGPSGFRFPQTSSQLPTGIPSQVGQSAATVSTTAATGFSFGSVVNTPAPAGFTFGQSSSQQGGGTDIASQFRALTLQQSMGPQQPSDEPISGNPVIAPTQPLQVARQTGEDQLSISAQQPPETSDLPQNAARNQRTSAPSGSAPPGSAPSGSAPPGSAPPAQRIENADTIEIAQLKHPRYRTMDVRMSSFRSWPNYLNQTPRQMAYAGFFHPGVADFARCFCCGGGLRNWEADDDPMVEHARWYPRCEYINKLKGTHFVQAVLRRHREHMAERQREHEVPQNTFLTPDPMTTSVAANLLEMGFTQERAREAILTVRRLRGRSEVSIEEVTSWMLDDGNTQHQEPADRGTTVNPRDTVATAPPQPPRPHTPASSGSGSFESAVTSRRDSDGHSSVEDRGRGSAEEPQGATGGAKKEDKPPKAKSSKEDSSDEKNKSGKEDYSSDEKTKKDKDKSSKEDYSSDDKSKKDKDPDKKKPKSKKDKKSKSRKGRSPASGEGASAEVDTKSLKEENKQLKQMQVCKICMDKYVSITFLPCGHLVCCEDCAKNMRKCPICRKRIKGQVRTFMS